MMCPTPAERLLDPQGRPYFLWDSDMTDEQFRGLLSGAEDELRGVLLGKLMRQAKPDDVFLYTTEGEIRRCWARLEPHLGRTREFWRWLLETWKAHDER